MQLCGEHPVTEKDHTLEVTWRNGHEFQVWKDHNKINDLKAPVESLALLMQIPRTIYIFFKKLDGVGPVDNRPSTDKLHHFVQKK